MFIIHVFIGIINIKENLDIYKSTIKTNTLLKEHSR